MMFRFRGIRPILPVVVRYGLAWFLLGCLALGLGSCGAAISGTLERGGTGDFDVSVTLSPAFADKMQNFMAFSQGTGSQGPGAPLIDAAEIARSLSAAPGVGSVSFRNSGPAALEGPVRIARLADFLVPPGGEGFISFVENPGGGGQAAITLNRQTVPVILSLISPDVAYYLNFIFAPIVTGERLSKDEYLTQLSLFHNPAVAQELSRSEIRVSLTFPGPLLSVKGGSFSGRTAEFVIPLVDLLVLTQPLSYQALWR